MSQKKECEQPFWKDPSVLMKGFSLQYQPTCEHYMGNFVIRILLLSFFVGMIASVVAGLSAVVVALLFGGLTAAAIIMTSPPVLPTKPDHHQEHKPHHKKGDTYHQLPYTVTVDPSGYLTPIKEHFVNGGSTQGSVQPVADPIGMAEVDAAPYAGGSLPDFTPPTSRNLFMNVLLDEIKYNPDRPEAATVGNPTVKQTMDDFFRVQWFSDPTDVFGKNQGQRQFVTQPSTTVPNDQGSFANWLYKIPGKTCKEGGRSACHTGATDGQLVWMNQDI
jgi:hypothetical protein